MIFSWNTYLSQTGPKRFTSPFDLFLGWSEMIKREKKHWQTHPRNSSLLLFVEPRCRQRTDVASCTLEINLRRFSSTRPEQLCLRFKMMKWFCFIVKNVCGYSLIGIFRRSNLTSFLISFFLSCNLFLSFFLSLFSNSFSLSWQTRE